MYEDSRSAVGQHQANMYEASTRASFHENPPEDRVTPTKRLSNSINKRSSIVSGQCPFSGAQAGAEI
jgi:hypothetical protein